MKTEQFTIDIDLDGKALTLALTPEAVLAVSNAADGLANAMAAISRLNASAMAMVINAGAGLKGEDAKGTAKAVAATNMVELSGKLTEFVAAMCNGGRPFKGA